MELLLIKSRGIRRMRGGESEFDRAQPYLTSGELHKPQKRASAALCVPHIRHCPRCGWSGKLLSTVLHELQ